MGGDHAPASVIGGAALLARQHPNVRFMLFGDEGAIQLCLAKHRILVGRCTVHHTPDSISMEDKPSVALRAGRNSSMRLAINAVGDGRADCVVSAGNTGALMAMAKFVLKTLPGIDRPAIAGPFPTKRGASVMLDLGANVDCDAGNLVQFAIMGAVYARIALGIPKPSVGLLNVGVEEMKGHESIRDAYNQLRQMDVGGSFHGFVEGDDIAAGTVDVVVTDGFTGNIALKTAEGTARLLAGYVRSAISASWLAKIGMVFALPALLQLRKRADPRRHNGAMFVGLRGMCVKSHGGADAESFANALTVGLRMTRERFPQRIAAELERAGAFADRQARSAAAEAATPSAAATSGDAATH
jgi:phosphate acyltransferase